MKPVTKAMPTSSGRSGSTNSARKRAAAWRKYIPWVVGAALLILVINGLRPKPTEVEIAEVTTGPLVVTVLEEGKTRIRHRYVVSAPVFGHLRRVDLRAGARIEAGKTVLATMVAETSALLNPRALAEAEARVKAAQAARDQREAALERASAALALAQKDRVRNEALRKKGAISAMEWDAVQNRATLLDREQRAAEFALRAAEFELNLAKAALLQAQSPTPENSEPLNIFAPVDGYVLNVYEESAKVISAGTPIMEVGNTEDLEAEIELLSSDAVGVQPGADVSIEQWGGEKPLRGKVSVVEPGGYTKVSSLGVEEQRVKVRVDFIDPIPERLTFGDRFRVEARIVTWRGENILQVPTGALFRRGGDWMTYRYDGGKARLTKVEIAHNNGVAAEIKGGLTQGQKVVLHPPDLVSDGSSIRPRQ